VVPAAAPADPVAGVLLACVLPLAAMPVATAAMTKPAPARQAA
jgi:hypothetical protein